MPLVGVSDLSRLKELRELSAIATGAMNREVTHIDIEAMLGVDLHAQLIGNAFADAL